MFPPNGHGWSAVAKVSLSLVGEARLREKRDRPI